MRGTVKPFHAALWEDDTAVEGDGQDSLYATREFWQYMAVATLLRQMAEN